MTIRITNKCNLGCLHCMENSIPTGKHMSMNTLYNVIDFIKLSKNTKTVNIGGGEPTEHPEFLTFVETVIKELSSNRLIIILSNGSFLSDKVLSNKIFSIIAKHKMVSLQITSIKGVYPKYDEIKTNYYNIFNSKTPIIKKIKDRVVFVTRFEHGILEVGRAVNNVEAIKEVTNIRDSRASKCFNMYNAMAHTSTLMEAIDMVKQQSQTALCIPLIKETGEVVFGEYDACTTVVNVNETKVTLDTKIRNNDGPCGHCVKTCSARDIMKLHLGTYYPNMLKDMEIRDESKN